MKKSINILMAGAFVAAIMGLTSCDDFLKESRSTLRLQQNSGKLLMTLSRVLQHSISVVCPT